MNRSDDDPEIRQHFNAARERRESLAPSFHEILERPRRNERPASFHRVRLLVTAFVVFAVLISAYLVWYEKPVPRPLEAELSALTEWHSPTDFLLKTPGGELLEGTPAIPSALPPLPNLQTIQNPSGNVK